MWGYIVAVLDASSVRVLPNNATRWAAATYKAGEWSMFTVDDSFGLSRRCPVPQRAWVLTPAQCPYFFFSDNSHSMPVTYVDQDDVFSVTSVVSFARADTHRVATMGISVVLPAVGYPMPLTSVDCNTSAVGNFSRVASLLKSQLIYDNLTISTPLLRGPVDVADAVLSLASGYARNYGVAAELDVGLPDAYPPGFFVYQSRPSETSLRCTQSLYNHRLVLDCPFSKQLFASAAGLPRKNLPFNYRPPSYRGTGVPITNNFYNGNPQQPRYNDFYPWSQNTGTYKQCSAFAALPAGDKSLRCGCTAEQVASTSVDNSDCINSAPAVNFMTPFVPKVRVRVDGRTLKTPPGLRYSLVELNNRTDWCLNTTDCLQDPTIALVDPNAFDAINWLGEELFHFRATVTNGTYCSMFTDFTVYVVAPPLTVAEEASVVMSGVYAIGLLLLVAYYFTRKTMRGSAVIEKTKKNN
jgi:hypothetical protein